jgi:signal transduction histidine kinase
VTNDRNLAELVSVACHDIATPLATVYGFARTLERAELEAPAGRYVEMIGAASEQIGELLDRLRLVARVEAGRYEPELETVDSLALAEEAAAQLDEGRVSVAGNGSEVRVDVEPTRWALGQLARAAARHGGHETVAYAVRGAELELSPLSRTAEPVVLGEKLLEFAAPAAGLVIEAGGGTLEARDGSLLVRLPE